MCERVRGQGCRGGRCRTEPTRAALPRAPGMQRPRKLCVGECRATMPWAHL